MVKLSGSLKILFKDIKLAVMVQDLNFFEGSSSLVASVLTAFLSVGFHSLYCLVWARDVLLWLTSLRWDSNTLLRAWDIRTANIWTTLLCCALLCLNHILRVGRSLLRNWSSSRVSQWFWLLEFGLSNITSTHRLCLHQIHERPIVAANSSLSPTHSAITLLHNQLRGHLLCLSHLVVPWKHDVVLIGRDRWVRLHDVPELDQVVSSVILVLSCVGNLDPWHLIDGVAWHSLGVLVRSHQHGWLPVAGAWGLGRGVALQWIHEWLGIDHVGLHDLDYSLVGLLVLDVWQQTLNLLVSVTGILAIGLILNILFYARKLTDRLVLNSLRLTDACWALTVSDILFWLIRTSRATPASLSLRSNLGEVEILHRSILWSLTLNEHTALIVWIVLLLRKMPLLVGVGILRPAFHVEWILANKLHTLLWVLLELIPWHNYTLIVLHASSMVALQVAWDASSDA